MKKKWNIMALIILLLQTFTPVIGVAQAAEVNKGFYLTDVEVNRSELKNSTEVNLNIIGNAQTSKAETTILTVSSNIALTKTSGTVVNEKKQQVGTYQQEQQQIIVKLDAELTETASLAITGKVVGDEKDSQTVTITSGTSSVTKEIPAQTTEEATKPDSSIDTTIDSSATKDSTTPTKPDKQVVAGTATTKRDPINIGNLLPSKDGQTSLITGMEVLGKDGKPITSGSIGDYFKFNMDMVIPEDIREKLQNGDYFEFQLPDQINITQNQNFTLTDENGEPYATVSITTDGKVVITFNEKITQESDVSGNFNFDGQFDKDSITGPGDIHVDTPFVDKQPGIDITIKPEVDSSVDKEGAFDKTPNPGKVIWNVDVNKAMDEITNATVTENFPDGLTFDSVKIYTVDVDFEGKVIPGSEKLVDPSDYTVDAKGNVTFKNKIDGAYRLTYESTIDEDKKPGADGGKVKFENKVNFDGDEINSIPASSTVTADYKKALEKGQVGYDPENQTFDWTIKYNYNEANIKESQATVTDTINSNMNLEDGSVVLNKVTFDAKGNPIEGAPLVEGQDYILVPKADGKGFDIQFIGDVDYAITIHYTTKVDEEIDEDTDFSNTVEDGSGNKDTEEGHAKQQGVVKDVNHVDQNAKIIEWVIEVNKNNYEMQNWSLTDQLGDGLTLLNAPFVIEDLTTGKSLKKDIDYTLDYDATTNRFKIVFLNSYLVTSDTFKIHYQTRYDIDSLPAGSSFVNTANSDWISTTDNTHKNPGDTADFKPNEESNNNGFKSGDYNAVDKKITWTLGVNYNRVPLKDAFITDPITGNQKFVPGSVKVFHYQITSDGKYIKGAEVTGAELDGFEILEPNFANNNVLSIHLPDGPSTSQYMFEYQTSLEGQVINDSATYTNTAKTTNVDSPDYSVTGEVSVAHGGNLAEKSGAQDENGFVNWSVNVNPSQSTISDVVVHDNPSTNQVVDEKSIIVYETTVAKDGTITKGAPLDPSKYHVVLTTDNETGLQHLQVAFDGVITTSYVLEYRSMIFLDSGNTGTVNNELTVTGKNHGEVTGGDNTDVTVNVSDGGGIIFGTKGSLTIRKTNDSQKALVGAKFELWDAKNVLKLREGQVDASGQLIFGALPYGTYSLKEVQAPIGYTIPDDLVTGREVTVTKESSLSGAMTNIMDPESAVTLVKKSESGALLAGATFKLELLIGTVWTPVRTAEKFITDSKGRLIVKGLDVGHYRFTETKAPLTPKEYILNTVPVEFDVTRNANGQIIPVTVGPFINYLGSAVFEKQDAKGNPLAGAEFTVKRMKDGSGNNVNETIATKVKSDATGKVNLKDLAPGVYEVTETKAPTGYLLNTSKLTFTIVQQASGPVATIDAGIFKNYQGSIQFTKKNEAKKTLAGAIFEVQDKAGKVIQTNLVSDSKGIVKVTDLAPGEYNLVEIKAPTGYLLNTHKTAFTIGKEANGQPNPVQLVDQINYQGSVVLTKINSSYDPLEGAEFTLYDENNQVVGVYTSAKDGKININDLAPGDYKLIETKAPLQPNGKPYIQNSYPITFTIGTKADGRPKQLDLGYYQNFHGKLVLTKKDGEGGAALAGAVFNLYRLGTTDPIATIATDKNGYLDYGKLAAGSYKLVEIKAPAGYVINTNPVYFVVSQSETGNTEDKFTFKNFQSAIEFNKVNEATQPLKGAEFKIIQKTDAAGTVVNQTIVENLVADKDGKYRYKGLEEGTYELIETKAATGYMLNTTPYEFNVEPSMNKAPIKLLANFINYRGAISFNKTDEKGKGLAGAEFKLFTKKGEAVKDVKGKEITATSNKDGKVSLDHLMPGEYVLKETKAPTGYLLNEAEIVFTIQASNAGKPTINQLPDFINYQGSAKLIKVDADNQQKVLSNAVFELVDEKGKIVYQGLKTNNLGEFTVERLAPGKYHFIETEAPTDYQLSKTSYEVVIPDKANQKPELITIMATNKHVEPSIPKVPQVPNVPNVPNTPNTPDTPNKTYPQTGEQMNNTLWMGLLLLGLSSLVRFKLKPKKTNN
ncbi:SpaA isopeptide-forming pilin-related protein [Carnobacterium gallinarum]|uniref:SpaA isopeptide-forming pilin-related protein n=1 Tax=Carnobacterium gallinarum TaxID=2749 RepID=UPI00068955EC|nr:SpaA isopeptide-forming pilin-related protein [Carnobacterium gallinarum]